MVQTIPVFEKELDFPSAPSSNYYLTKIWPYSQEKNCQFISSYIQRQQINYKLLSGTLGTLAANEYKVGMDFVSDIFVPTRDNTADLFAVLECSKFSFRQKTSHPFKDIFFDLPLVSPVLEITYVNRTHVENLLGEPGKDVLKRVLGLVQSSATLQSWPLEKVEISCTHDYEVEDWEYVSLVFIFNCSFEEANKSLHEFYDYLDALADKLSENNQALLRGLFFFDIEIITGISIP